jgi:hypothetical protein
VLAVVLDFDVVFVDDAPPRPPPPLGAEAEEALDAAVAVVFAV